MGRHSPSRAGWIRTTASVAVTAALLAATGCGPAPSPTAIADRPAAPVMPQLAPAAAALPAAPTVTSEPWNWECAGVSTPGETLVTAHYRVNVTLREGSLKRMYPTFAEAALEHYTTTLGRLPDPPHALETMLFGTRSQWEDFTKERLGNDADTYLALGRGGYTIDGLSVLYDLGRWDTLALAAHEGWHQYSQATFKHALPIWLEEGMATYMEGHRWGRNEERPTFAPWRNFERFGELREAARADELIPLDELIEGAPQRFLRRDGRSKLLTYYAQVWALTQFIAEGENGRYRAALETLLQDAAAGRLAGKIATSPNLPPGRPRSQTSRMGKAVVLAYLNPDFAEFKQNYERFVAALVDRGMGDYIGRGESPVKAMKLDATR